MPNEPIINAIDFTLRYDAAGFERLRAKTTEPRIYIRVERFLNGNRINSDREVSLDLVRSRKLPQIIEPVLMEMMKEVYFVR
jgi:hypothetical protein